MEPVNGHCISMCTFQSANRSPLRNSHMFNLVPIRTDSQGFIQDFLVGGGSGVSYGLFLLEVGKSGKIFAWTHSILIKFSEILGGGELKVGRRIPVSPPPPPLYETLIAV